LKVRALFFHVDDQDTEGRMFPVDDWGNLAFSDEDYLTTWKAMEELVDDELVRSLGVCNFNSAQLDRLMQHCDVKPLVNQVLQRWLSAYIYVVTLYLICVTALLFMLGRMSPMAEPGRTPGRV
jgi:aryl-alcohol dehydrogenase-like predicted oxidoreductase